MSKRATKKKAKAMARAEGEYNESISNTFSTVLQDCSNFQSNINNGGVTQGGWSDIIGQLNMFARVIKGNVVPTSLSNYRKYNGQPLYQTMKLKSLIGYTLVGAIHIENLGNAVADEKEEVENILHSGVILPET